MHQHRLSKVRSLFIAVFTNDGISSLKTSSLLIIMKMKTMKKFRKCVVIFWALKERLRLPYNIVIFWKDL